MVGNNGRHGKGTDGVGEAALVCVSDGISLVRVMIEIDADCVTYFSVL